MHSWTLWVFPSNSPVRLEFLPLLPQPPQVFSARGFEALFACNGTQGCTVCLAPQLFLLVYLHENVGLPSQQALTLPAQVLHPLSCCESSPPTCPSSPLLLVWMNFLSLTLWMSDFHTVRFFFQFWFFFVFKFVVVLLFSV